MTYRNRILCLICIMCMHACGTIEDQRKHLDQHIHHIQQLLLKKAYKQIFSLLDYKIRIAEIEDQWIDKMKLLDQLSGHVTQINILEVELKLVRNDYVAEVYIHQIREEVDEYMYWKLMSDNGQFKIRIWDSDRDIDWLRAKRKAIDFSDEFYDGQVGHYFEKNVDQLSVNLTNKIREEHYVAFLREKTKEYGPLLRVEMTNMDMEMRSDVYRIECQLTTVHERVQLYETLVLLSHKNEIRIENYQYYSDPSRSLELDVNGLEALQIGTYFISALHTKDTTSLNLLLDKENTSNAILWFDFLTEKDRFAGPEKSRRLIGARKRDVADDLPKFVLDYKVDCTEFEIYERLHLIKREGNYKVSNYIYDTHQKGLDD